MFDNKNKNNSNGNYNSDGNYNSNGNSYSNGNYGSDGNYQSNGNSCSNGNYHSRGNYGSDGNYYSDGNSLSNGNYHSDGNYNSHGLVDSYGTYKSMFSKGVKGVIKIFGKYVSEKRADEIRKGFYNALNGWRPKANTIHSLYIKHGSDWKKTPVKDAEGLSSHEAWKDMPKDAVNYLKSLPEFDAGLFKEITGIDVSKPDVVDVTVEGNTVIISRESAIALGLLKHNKGV